MRPRESLLYRWVEDAVKGIDRRAVSWKLQDQFRSGLPDQLVCVSGRAAWIESKQLHGTRPQPVGLTAQQYGHLTSWHAAGGHCGLLVAWNDWIYWIVPPNLPNPAELVHHARLRELAGSDCVVPYDKRSCAALMQHVL